MELQLNTVKDSLTLLQNDFQNVSKALRQGQEMFLKNLESARDIYKRQYLALEQILEEMQKAGGATTTPAPTTTP